jgi:hypothetical protein
MPSPAASLNTLICKAILALILKGFKRFSALHITYRRQLATHTPHTQLLKKSLKAFRDGRSQGSVRNGKISLK